MNVKDIPVSAFDFKDTEAVVDLKEGEGSKSYILGYSGKIIKGHWYWGDLAIDVNGAQFPKKVYPVLDSHMTERRIGFTSKPDTSNKNLMFDNLKFVSTPAAEEFQKLSKEGFPFEASISGRPQIVEEIMEGESAEVNGYSMKGPGSIWRKWTFKEVSVCVFGADSGTKSKAFSDSEEKEAVEFMERTPAATAGSKGDEPKTQEEVQTVFKTISEFKEKCPELYASFTEEMKASLEGQFKAEKGELEKSITAMRTDLDSANESIRSFQKAEVLRTEKDRKSLVERIWTDKLTLSELPAHLYGKIKNQVPEGKFLKDGAFDEAAFSAAVDAEIKDWLSLGVKKSAIDGFGATQKDLDAEKMKETETKNWVAEMKKLAGQVA
jgi:hypothetical protein